MKKKFMENKKFRLIAVFLITVLIVGGFSFAWFYFRQSQSIGMSVSNFKAEPECSFVGVTEEGFKSYVDEKNGLITLSTDSGDPNYIGNFRVKVNYSGDGAGYLRVRMVHKFTTGTSNVAVQHPAELPYATTDTLELSNEKNSLWYDNRDVDYCYYYSEELDADDNDVTKSVDLIKGLIVEKDEKGNPTENDGAKIVEGFAEANSVIKVAVEADMVQINRYPQIWGDLPWK